jgi:hypothetical protein
MAIDMHAAYEALAPVWRARGHELGLGIGIAMGYATIGAIGFEGRRDYAAIGTVMNFPRGFAGRRRRPDPHRPEGEGERRIASPCRGGRRPAIEGIRAARAGLPCEASAPCGSSGRKARWRKASRDRAAAS